MKAFRKLSAFLLACLMILLSVSCSGTGKNETDITTDNYTTSENTTATNNTSAVTTEDDTTAEITTTEDTTAEETHGELVRPGKSVVYLSAQSVAQRAEKAVITADKKAKAADFAIRLFSGCYENGKNELVSPLSVMTALSMTVNGAAGETKTAMENVLGMSTAELNEYLNTFYGSLKNTDKASLLSTNSVWVGSDRRFSVEKRFVDTVKSYYDAEIVSAPFQAPETLDEVNGWVNRNTNGMIDKALDELNEETIMLLINAVTFDAQWSLKFEDEAVFADFTDSDGNTVQAKTMYGNAETFIRGDNCTGFIKKYADGNYNYVALLPDNGVSIENFLAGLDGEKLLSIIRNGTNMNEDISMPKYTLDFDYNMRDILSDLGMGIAFSDEKADFHNIGVMDDGSNIFIENVIHKTHIQVDESGTKAAAVTVVIGNPECCETATVNLDRPFVYAITDKSGLPVFIGVINNPG